MHDFPDETARVTTLELFFDLVFVFTTTQLKTFLAASHLTGLALLPASDAAQPVGERVWLTATDAAPPVAEQVWPTATDAVCGA